jgi:DNA-binding MarR family transcriptional regulator
MLTDVGGREELAREIWMSVLRLFLSDEHQQMLGKVANDQGLTGAQLKSLMALTPDQPKSMRALAEEWFVDASYVTVLIDGLERHGFVRRETPSTDRRVKLITLTPEGIAARERAIEQMSMPPSGLCELPDAELRQLRSLLEHAAKRYPQLV